MKLHLGCGKRNFGEDWIHIDGGEFPHLHSHNIVDLPFDNESIDLIYVSHVIEYFDREEIKEVLNKWYSKFKKGGILRVAVPDFQTIAELYVDMIGVQDEYPLEYFLGPLYGKIKLNNNIIYHKTVYDYNSLKIVLENDGFKNLCYWDWKKVNHRKFDDCSKAHIPHDLEAINTGIFNKHTLISLNIECEK